jgi:putative ATPase
MRPRNLQEYVGQEHFLGPGKLLRRMLDAGRLGSLIFYGPPGSGKTALARIVAGHTQSRFVALNAVASGTKEVREVIEAAKRVLEDGGTNTILFIDEIHRFNKTQQDVLLPDVESGVITLIGATTQNPMFALNAPLLSRSTLFTFEPLSRDHIKTLLHRALHDEERGLGKLAATADEEAIAFLAECCDGDARRALNALEIAVLSMVQSEDTADAKRVTLEVAQDSMQRKILNFDPSGDTHYDVISAFIKSMRGSDPDAAIYWLARMLESGEDPRFIARRVVICASEDVGNADPQALVVATAALQATEFVGLPECQLALAQAVTYIATAPKSNAATVAIGQARHDVQSGRTFDVPKHLRDANSRGGQRGDGGQGYDYSHDHPDGWVDQQYLPDDRRYYEPTDRGYEQIIRQRLEELRRRRNPPAGN